MHDTQINQAIYSVIFFCDQTGRQLNRKDCDTLIEAQEVRQQAEKCGYDAHILYQSPLIDNPLIME
jgi:prophage antirepressor-like protein